MLLFGLSDVKNYLITYATQNSIFLFIFFNVLNYLINCETKVRMFKILLIVLQVLDIFG